MSQTFYVYTDSYEMSPTQRISEVIPWTKQVGVGAPTQRILKKYHGQSKLGLRPQQRIPKKFHGQSKLGLGPQQREFEEIPRTKQVGVGEKTGDNEFYPSLAFILIRGILQS